LANLTSGEKNPSALNFLIVKPSCYIFYKSDLGALAPTEHDFVVKVVLRVLELSFIERTG